MKALGIVGSSRKKGNTACLVRQALDGLKEHGIDTEMVYLADHHISDCTGCEGCRDTFECVIGDDMQAIYPKLLEADAVVLGSPTYFYDVTAIMKAFLDRLYCFEAFDGDDRCVWMGMAEALGVKLAAVISVSEQKREEDAGFAAKTMAMSLQALGYRVTDSVRITGLYAQEEASLDLKAQERARAAGKRLAKTLILKRRIRETMAAKG